MKRRGGGGLVVSAKETSKQASKKERWEKGQEKREREECPLVSYSGGPQQRETTAHAPTYWAGIWDLGEPVH